MSDTAMMSDATKDLADRIAALELAKAKEEIAALSSQIDELEARICDECDGSGTFYLSDENGKGDPQACVCVSETVAYQFLQSELAELKARIEAGR